jgi:hypothetical protein
MMTPMIHQITKTLFLLLLAASFGSLVGCAALGAGASKLSDDTEKAKYVPNKKDRMLVLVESYGLTLDSDIEAQHLTLSLRKAILDAKVAPLVDQQTLESLKDANPDQFQPMTIAEIGRKVGAGQVLYVNIWRAEIDKPPGSGQVRGSMDAVVKIVDTATGDTRWPGESSSDAVQITTNWFPDSQKSDTDVRAQMADQMAEDIGKLFHDYHTGDEYNTPEDAKVNVD